MAFGGLAEFAEGLVVAFGLEKRVVAKAIFAARFLDDFTFAHAVENFWLSILPRARQRDDAAEARGAVVFALAGKFVQEFGVVFLVGGVARV